MKKLICLLLCPLFLLSASCNKKSSDVTAVTTGLKFTAKIENSNLKHEFLVTIDKDGIIKISSNESKISVTANKNQLTIEYGELSYKTDISSLPNGDLKLLINLLTNNSERKVIYENEQYLYNLKIKNYDFTVFLAQSGLPLKITESTTKTTISIFDATLI